MVYKILIKTKNFNALNRYLKLLYTLKKSKYLTNITFLDAKNEKKQKIFTLLKSPHINKTAREQIGYTIHEKHLLIYTKQPNLLSVILKKLNTNSVFDLSIKILIHQNKKFL